MDGLKRFPRTCGGDPQAVSGIGILGLFSPHLRAGDYLYTFHHVLPSVLSVLPHFPPVPNRKLAQIVVILYFKFVNLC